MQGFDKKRGSKGRGYLSVVGTRSFIFGVLVEPKKEEKKGVG